MMIIWKYNQTARHV